MALTNLGLALADAGMADRAVGVQTRAREIFTRTLGDTHSSTLLAGDRLADALAAAGRPVRAGEIRAEVDETAERPNKPEPVRSS